ncbi:MAG TPA: DUF3667 domain-containing protein [Cytophagaceae bacterium]|jgi:hypothetical protein|nr:DUF3667 domain-containing protein [Cytophagaceae bacterium]
MVCPNCETVYEGNFCPECGQKTIHGRYTLKGLASELIFSAFHLEKKGLPYTIKELTLRPGVAIRNVLEGQRLSLYPPFKYLILVGTVIVILSLRYGFFHSEELTSADADTYQISFLSNVLSGHQIFFDGFFIYAEDYATLLNLIAIPIFSLFSFLFFKEYGYNFAESLIINTFITAQQLLFLVLLVPFIEFFPGTKHILIPIYTVVMVLYNVSVYVQLYGYKFSNVYRSVIAVITSYIYQFPVNLAVYYILSKYVFPAAHWLPELKLH